MKIHSDSMDTRSIVPALMFAAWLVSVALPGSAAAAEPEAGPKVPVALAWGPDDTLYVALRDGRSVAAVEPHTWTVVAGWDLPIRPISLALADVGTTLLVGGSDGHVVVLDPRAERGRHVVRDLAIGRGPTRVLPLPDGQAAVASQWDPVVRVIDWRQGRVLAEHPLPFAPGALVRRRDGRVVAADAFGGRFVDLRPGDVGRERYFALDGVNLRALGISGDGKELLIAHMF